MVQTLDYNLNPIIYSWLNFESVNNLNDLKDWQYHIILINDHNNQHPSYINFLIYAYYPYDSHHEKFALLDDIQKLYHQSYYQLDHSKFHFFSNDFLTILQRLKTNTDSYYL